MESPSDELLLQRVFGGDNEALTVLVARYHRPLLGYLYRLTNGDRPLAEDLTQETFARLLRPANFQAGRPFKPWLYAIATNLARDTFRCVFGVRSAIYRDRAIGVDGALPPKRECVLTHPS